MVTFRRQKQPAGRPKRPQRTSISFSARELEALGRLLAAGQVMLQSTTSAVPRLKAAMTRLGVTHPRGL